MYERLLDKLNMPTYEDFTAYCGERGALFDELDGFLLDVLKAERILRFPYGNSYGWGMKYFIKSRHICDLFAEKDAFTVMLRLSDEQYKREYDGLTAYTKALIDGRYPCGDGGWIHCRVLTPQHVEDMKKLLSAKVAKNA